MVTMHRVVLEWFSNWLAIAAFSAKSTCKTAFALSHFELKPDIYLAL